MHILVVSQYFWPENFRINDLVKGLLERGDHVTVLTGKPNYPEGRYYQGYGAFRPTREDYAGAKVVRVPLIPRLNGRGPALVLNYLSFALSASLLGPFLCREHYDVVFVYEPSPITVGLPALLMKKIKSAPMLFWVQDLWPESLRATGAVKSAWILRQVGKLVRLIYRGSDRVLITSEAYTESVVGYGAAPDRVEYFPQSAESIFRPLNDSRPTEIKTVLPEGFCVLFAGNIGVAQNFETILDAAERLKGQLDIHWVILGDGRMLNQVRKEVKERELTEVVHLLGKYPVEDMPAFFAAADVLLMTLKADPIFSLTVPAKIQSYLACAKPIIAAIDGEGARVVSESGAGISVRAENPEALAEAVLGMYHLPVNERLAMGANGRKYYEKHFEREMLLSRLQGWMRELSRSDDNRKGQRS